MAFPGDIPWNASASLYPMFEQLLERIPQDEVAKILKSPLLFAETFLLTPNTGEPFKANYVESKILSSTHRYNVIRVHRRAGKSWALSTLALHAALTQKNIEVLVICPDGSKVATIFDRIREFLVANEVWRGYIDGDRQNLPQRITFKNGSKITGFTTAAKTKGEATALRSQGADVLLIDEAAYLGEGDWGAIQPIMTGDMYRRRGTRVYIASTPAYTRGHYYALCKDPFHQRTWKQVFVSIDDNPDITQELYDDYRATCGNELDWRKEFLAEFPELGEGVFPKTMVDTARRQFTYSETLQQATEQSARGEKPPTRTIGVDWDKYNADGHGSNIVVLEAIDSGRYRLIYREEIAQSQFTLSNAVRRVIELNDIFQPEWVFIDKGFGEYQLEELQKYGKSFPKTGLAKKVIGVAFWSTIECPMPGGGVEKKRFKQAMVSLMRTWFERANIEIAGPDTELHRDLIEYHVKSQSESNIKFSETNDHSIAALGLAAMAMHQKVRNPYSSPAATRTYVVPVPISVPSETLRKQYGREYRRNPLMGSERPEFDMGDSFSRRSLGSSLPTSRSNF
jgi:hypothetical protein